MSQFQTCMSPDKFLEVAFFVSCVALIVLVTKACVESEWETKQLAKLFVLFVDVGDGFLEMAIDCIGLEKHISQRANARKVSVSTCSSIDSANRSAST